MASVFSGDILVLDVCINLFLMQGTPDTKPKVAFQTLGKEVLHSGRLERLIAVLEKAHCDSVFFFLYYFFFSTLCSC